MTLLKIDNLKTHFYTQSGIVQAVRGISFELKQGDALGIVGESGSGKSVANMSILRLNAANAKIVEGSIIFKDRDLSKVSQKEIRKIRGEEISMIFQDPMSSLNPLISVGKQVGEMIKIHRKDMTGKEIKDRVLELFHLVRIPEAEKRYSSFPHEFSGGMRQRVMIAMALALDPEILIADEPTTALDVTIQDQIIKLLAKLQREKQMSIIFITHDLAVVAELCNRVIVMYAGMIMEEAPIEALFKNPAHPYTMGLFHSMPRVDQQKSQRLEPILGSPPDMLNPPKGCPFAPRCKYARKICVEELPPLVIIGEGHSSLCWLQTEEGLLQQGNPFRKEAI
ncbi:MAG: ABC transporter ATP-binding protein [Tissierellia bacterium]|nr:ABC transporter ATP-binding protein [Tissierellia bacterium]